MKKILVTGCVALALVVSVAGQASAKNEFENGFKTELGAIAARSAVGLVFDGIFGGAGNQYMSSDYRPTFNNYNYQPNSGRRQPYSYNCGNRGCPPPHQQQRVVYEQPTVVSGPATVPSATAVSFSNTATFKVLSLRATLGSFSNELVSWSDMQKVLILANGVNAQSVSSTEGISFGTSAFFRRAAVESALGQVGVEIITWQDLQKILARSLI